MSYTSKPELHILLSGTEDGGLIDRGSNKGPFNMNVGSTVCKYYGYLRVEPNPKCEREEAEKLKWNQGGRS